MIKDSYVSTEEVEVFTLKEVAEILKVDPQTVSEYIDRSVNPLPVVKITQKTFRILKLDLIEWLKSQPDPRREV